MSDGPGDDSQEKAETPSTSAKLMSEYWRAVPELTQCATCGVVMIAGRPPHSLAHCRAFIASKPGPDAWDMVGPTKIEPEPIVDVPEALPDMAEVNAEMSQPAFGEVVHLPDVEPDLKPVWVGTWADWVKEHGGE